MRPAPALLALLLALGATGCASSPAARIEERAAVYRALTPEQQQCIARGAIRVGFTKDMVYMALGRPSDKEPEAGDSGMERWVYRNYFPPQEIAAESLYQQPSSDEGNTRSLRGAVGNVGQISDGGPPESASGAADVEAATMTVWFAFGRVSRFDLKP